MQGVLKALGVRVRRIADLDEGALYLSNSRILLLDLELSESEITQAMDDVLFSAFA